jgi:uncharacterized protein (TIGR03435 family)
MKLATMELALTVCTGGLVLAQSPEAPPKFEAADVHVSENSANPFVRTGTRGGRYEIKNATMVDLIRIAYSFDPDKVLGGPNWLELDRFDVIAKVPPDSSSDLNKLMLRALLEERFHLRARTDTKPLSTYALVLGKKPQLKEASGSAEPGCRPKIASGAPGEGGGGLRVGNPDGTTTTINLGPGMTVQYKCQNVTMGAFAAALRGMIGSSLGPNPIVDQTELTGHWTFDLTYSMQGFSPVARDADERISINAAIEKQLGLKLEQRLIPTPVLIVEAVERRPTENRPNVAEILPNVGAPTEFEVATIKPADPSKRMTVFQLLPGGRLNIQGMPLRFLLYRAFEINNNEQLVGIPAAIETDNYDVVGKLPEATVPWGPADIEAVAKPLLALLVDRFNMTYHRENRPVSTYLLVAAKPKMKKADPASRIFCRGNWASAPAPPGMRVMTCQNITMAQFADRLRNQAPGLQSPVLDATGLEGSWDFALSFDPRASMITMAGPGRAGGAGAPGNPVSASDPVGGYTIFDALEKETGLRLEKQKRAMPVVVIDHIDPRPTDN